jgi:hypothetical protein
VSDFKSGLLRKQQEKANGHDKVDEEIERTEMERKDKEVDECD